MRIADLFVIAFSDLRRTKGRVALTMIGIVVGVTSVIVVLSLGEAAERSILGQINAFGSDSVFIANGPPQEPGQLSFFAKESLTVKDVSAVESFPWVSAIAGRIVQNEQLIGNGTEMAVQLIGTMPDEPRLTQVSVGQGQFFLKEAVDGHAREIVLGSEVAKKIFGQDSAVGKLVKLSQLPFRVVGIMNAGGTQGFQNVDRQVYIPISTALDLSDANHVTYISAKVTLPLPEAKELLTIALRERHGISNPTNDLTKDDFHIETQEDVLRTAQTITLILRILLISIAAISLLVGGIGIMNMMYMSVTERIQEIGLRKALGARYKDILAQFLSEAVIQTLIGGCGGVALGLGLSWIAIQILGSVQSGWTFTPSPSGITLGLGVSVLIGLIFGYLPAKRAARLHPIESLRAE